jgi:hypothetical protein
MSDALLASLAGALSGALVGAITSVIGWYVGAKHSAEVRRQQAEFDYLETQIEELYGPLYGLIQQTKEYHDLEGRIATTVPEAQPATNGSSEEHWEIWRFFSETYFLPLNTEIRDLIRTKIYLLESGTMPKSFNAFFLHEADYQGRYRLWTEKNIRTEGSGFGWPGEFSTDVKETLERLTERHQHYLQHLED